MANFCFSFISKEDVLKEITILYTSKAIQESNIPAKMIKENGDFFFFGSDIVGTSHPLQRGR